MKNNKIVSMMSLILSLSMFLGLFTTTVDAAINWMGYGVTITGTGEIKDDVLNLTKVGSATTIGQINCGLKTNFDVTAEIQVTGDGSTFQIYTGTNRVYMVLDSDKLRWMGKDYDKTKIFSSIPYDVGNGKHTYRIIGNGEDCELYIDGYFITEFDVHKNTTSGMIRFVPGQSMKVFSVKSVAETATVGSVKEINYIPEEGVHYNFDGNEDYSFLTMDNVWSVKDGMLIGNADVGKSGSVKGYVPVCDDFELKMRMKMATQFLSANTGSFSIDLHSDDRYLSAYINEETVRMRHKVDMSYSEYVDIGQEWHDWSFKSYDSGRRLTVSLDGKPIADVELPDETRYAGLFSMTARGSSATFNMPAVVYIDSMSLELTNRAIRIKTPMSNAVYLEGESIPISVDIKNTENIPYLDYKLNGETVATGKAEDGYRTEIKSLKQGAYTLRAEYNGNTTASVGFNVITKTVGNLKIKEEDNDNLIVSTYFVSGIENISEIEYLVDGYVVANTTVSPYTATVSGVTNESHTITAVLRNTDGIVVDKISKDYTMTDTRNPSINYSNEVNYTVSGTKGNASINVSNGNHKLYMSHTPQGVFYNAKNGEGFYEGKNGSYKILTDGPYADVYYEGQLAFSFIMPQTDVVEESIVTDGMEINEFSIKIPENRRNYFVQRDISEKEAVYVLNELPYFNNMDFVAGKNSNLRLVLNDGYYKTEVSIEDGKFYVMNATKVRAVPEKTMLAEIPDTDKPIYFRVETAAGITRISANGEYIGAFRGSTSRGAASVAIKNSSGENIPYISVNDNTDLYLYEDEFDGNGVFDSADYWRQSNMTSYIDKSMGLMMLNAIGKEHALSELNISACDADISLDLSVRECRGGVWFITASSAKDVYTKIGYNFETGNYEIINSVKGVDEVKTAKGSFPIAENVTMTLNVRRGENGKISTLYVDGKPVISSDTTLDNNGRIGLAINDGLVYLDSVKYRGDAKPILSVLEDVHSDASPTFDLIEDGEDYVLINSNNRYRSSNKGESWTKEAALPKSDFNVLRLSSGELISIYKETITHEDGSKVYPHYVSISTDNGATWQDWGRITDKPLAGYAMNNRITQGKSGRIYWSASVDTNEDAGIAEVFYSDDKGKTWTRSKTYLDGYKYNTVVAETVVLEMLDGTVRVYFRTKRGYVCYVESNDKGETFDMENIKSTPFLSVTNCFNIERDPYDETTLYAAWGYDWANHGDVDQRRRTRVAIAKSCDEGKTWEFLGTAYEFNFDAFYYTRGNPNLIMNININVTEKDLVLNFYCRKELETAWTSRVIVVDKDKLVPSKKFEQLHLMNAKHITGSTMFSDYRLERTMIADSKNKTVLLNGEIYENSVESGKISLALAAAFVGAEVKVNDDGSLFLKRGDGVITVDRSEISTINNKIYISLEKFAQMYGLNVCSVDDIQIISEFDSWMRSQEEALMYSVDAFSDINID